MEKLMEQRLSLITLGVADLPRAKHFYESVLGWQAAPSPPDVVFFDLGGIILSLYSHADLARDMKTSIEGDHLPEGVYRGFTLAYNVRGKEDADVLFSRLRASNVTVVKDPEEAAWGGYVGYFSDLDGHKWEVAYNPHWTILPDGRVSMSKTEL